MNIDVPILSSFALCTHLSANHKLIVRVICETRFKVKILTLLIQKQNERSKVEDQKTRQKRNVFLLLEKGNVTLSTYSSFFNFCFQTTAKIETTTIRHAGVVGLWASPVNSRRTGAKPLTPVMRHTGFGKLGGLINNAVHATKRTQGETQQK